MIKSNLTFINLDILFPVTTLLRRINIRQRNQIEILSLPLPQHPRHISKDPLLKDRMLNP